MSESKKSRPEHTCAGMYDMSCEACGLEETNLPGPEDSLPRSYYDSFNEPEEWDVVGGL